MLHSRIKKGEGQPLWIIVAAALALIVLVMVSYALITRWGLFGKSLNQCDGQCVSDRSKCPAGTAGVPTKLCESGGQQVENGFCCVAYG